MNSLNKLLADLNVLNTNYIHITIMWLGLIFIKLMYS